MRELLLRTSASPGLDGFPREWTMAAAPIDVVFLEKPREADAAPPPRPAAERPEPPPAAAESSDSGGVQPFEPGDSVFGIPDRGGRTHRLPANIEEGR